MSAIDYTKGKNSSLISHASGGVGLGVIGRKTASLGCYGAFRSERLPANLTQAQRDFFGDHTYRRRDREGVFHTDWSAPMQSS